MATVMEPVADLDVVRTKVSSILNHLGQIAAGLAVVDPESLPGQGAGYGSRVTVRDVATGETDEYTLMVGTLVDIDANQVSLASPIGLALLGKVAGDEITVTTPQKQARLVVTRVITLMQLLDDPYFLAA
jgi:transcription elongation factor GreA